VIAFAVACAPEPAPKTWPAGTVLVMDGEPISEQEVDTLIEPLLELEAAYTQTHRRRLVLTNVVLPRAFSRARYPEERIRAREEALTAQRTVSEGEPPDVFLERLTGNWDVLGLETWITARGLELGRWSEVIEFGGRFVLVRVNGRDYNAVAGLENFDIDVASYPYMIRYASLQELYIEGELEIVDPAWREIVPGFYKYHLRADQP